MQYGDEVQEDVAYQEAITSLVDCFLEQAMAEGFSLLEAACALFEYALEQGHESGHQCAALQASAHNHDAGDVRSRAGYL